MCILDFRLLGRMNFEWFLIVSMLVGLVLGDLEKGLLVGVFLELMLFGLVNIGVVVLLDMNMVFIIVIVFVILFGFNVEIVLIIVILIFVLG